ncbi:50S ribosomal protein L31e [Candidatus Bathyarchaeota archaeon]|nr:MAG: 50S ribosomal protein L31e [Candidatus Bathyarchaeota archaeon]
MSRVKTDNKDESEEEKIVEERVYTVPLSRAWIGPRNKRAPRAIRILRRFILRHMKIDEESLKIMNEVNERIWSRGIEKPPRKIRIRATKNDEGIVTVHLAEGE